MKLRLLVGLLIGVAMIASNLVVAEIRMGRAQEDVVLEPGDTGSRNVTVTSSPGTLQKQTGPGAPGVLRVDIGMYQYNIECGVDSVTKKALDHWTHVVIRKAGVSGVDTMMITKNAKGRLEFSVNKVQVGQYCDYQVKGACDYPKGLNPTKNAGLPGEFYGAVDSVQVFDVGDPTVFCFAAGDPGKEIYLRFVDY